MNGFGIEWEEEGEENNLTEKELRSQNERNEKRNPIMISSQQGFTTCTTLLYKYGYRIPQIPRELNDEKLKSLRDRTRSQRRKPTSQKDKTDNKPKERKESTEGDREEFRFRERIVTTPSSKEDQVKKLMLFKAYADPHYLSLAFTNHELLSHNDNLKKDEITELQQLDPLRRAFDLAEKAEIFTSSIHGMSELKNDYKEIKEELESYTASLLTQCSSMEEVKQILEHNPMDEDEDEDDDEEQNWQKALLEGRKDFVGHPFYQQYFFQRKFGDTKSGLPRRLQKYPKVERFVWNLVHCPWVTVLRIEVIQQS